jgi:uncharacterized protein (DUF1501 family)
MTVAGQRSNLAFTRRRFAMGAAAAGVLCGAGFLRTPASAASARDPRFVVIILRGAMDGLSAIPTCTASSPSRARVIGRR